MPWRNAWFWRLVYGCTLAACAKSAPAPAIPPPAPAQPEVPLTPGPIWPALDDGGVSSAPTVYVATNGSDTADGSEVTPFATIQHALDVLASGEIRIQPGTYHERLVLPSSARDATRPLLLSAEPGAVLTSNGAGSTPTDDLIYLEGVSFVRISGLTLVGSGKVSDASGIRVYGSGQQIALVGNDISELRGDSAMGITIYGSDGPGVRDVLIDNNSIHDSDPAPSEALVVNGNVQRYQISNNQIRDVNNIGIDVVAGERWLSSELPGAGRIVGNDVLRANSNYDGSAAGIYVDGASNVIVEKNRVRECDFGIEIGAENPGIVASNVTVRDNFIARNFSGGLIFGGYDASRGRVAGSFFVHNSLYADARPGEKTAQGYSGQQNGEVIVQYAEGCSIEDNVLQGTPDADELVSYWGEASVLLDYNLYDPTTAGQLVSDAHASFGDPQFVDPENGDLHLRASSPAIHAGIPLAAASLTDFDGEPRDPAAPDIGADEEP